MLVTVKEAKHNLLCPMRQPSGKSCWGDFCMLWFWYAVFNTDGTEIPVEQRRGYCGLAGERP